MTTRDPGGDEGLHDPERDAVLDVEKAPKDQSASDNDGDAAAESGMASDDSAPTPPDDAEPEAQRTPLETNLIVAALCSALFLAALDITIITTAIPTIAQEFRSPLGYTWVGSAYLLANAVSVPSWGKFSDIWGRKPILLAAVANFWIGSLLCAVSVNMGMLIAARAIQGVGGGGIVVLVNICIGDLFSLRRRGIYYGLMGMVWAIASAIGPILGGVFTSQVTWRWCFYVNLPISGVCFAVLVFVLKLHNPKTPVRQGLAAVDWTGSALIIGGTLMFLFGLEFGGIAYPWNSPTTICLIVFGVLVIVLFYLFEKKFAEFPIIPARLFTPWQNILAFFVCFSHGMVFISGSYWLPLYFQAVLGASSLLSGVYLLPFAVSLSIVSAITGVYMKKSGKYLPAIIFGMFVLTLGFGLFIDLGARANFAKIIMYQLVAGVGVGPIFQAPLVALQSRVERRDVASATSTFGFVRQLSTSISVVIGGVIFQNSMEKQHPSLLAALGPEIANQLTGGNAAGNVGFVASLPGDQGDFVKATYWHALRNVYIFSTVIAGLGLLVSPLIGSNVLSKEHKEYKTGLDSLRKEDDQLRRLATVSYICGDIVVIYGIRRASSGHVALVEEGAGDGDSVILVHAPPQSLPVSPKVQAVSVLPVRRRCEVHDGVIGGDGPDPDPDANREQQRRRRRECQVAARAESVAHHPARPVGRERRLKIGRVSERRRPEESQQTEAEEHGYLQDPELAEVARGG
ncbi:hypothetical protein DL767_006648 [Monosporascus sp. MG133]|nr:hypothetical protein DL767_006648 [Monosporascus sp. MG133]